MATAKKSYKFPKTMGACADLVYQLREKRLAGQKLVDEVEAEEKALKEHIINNLPKSQTTGVAGKLARVTAGTKKVPQVDDWDAFWKGFNKKKDVDLLPRSLNKAAVEARWDAGKQIAGVKALTVVTLSINKV